MNVTHADFTIERRYPFTPAQTGRFDEFRSRSLDALGRLLAREAPR